jgi:signal transduction histidine kinase
MGPVALVDGTSQEVRAHRSPGAGGPHRGGDRPLAHASEAVLTRRLRRGDADALSEIVLRHAAPVAATITQTLHSADGWEEILQDVFLDLWVAPERFGAGAGDLRSYLCRQGRSRALERQDEPQPEPQATPATNGTVRAEQVKPPVGMVMDLARSVVRMVARQRLERILAKVAVDIASGKAVADCLVPAFDDLGAVMGASVVALFPRKSPPIVRRTGPADSELELRLFMAALRFEEDPARPLPDDLGVPGWAALHAPVELHADRAATLSVLRRSGEPFVRDEREVVARLASLVALAWAAERYQHQLAEIARLRERERIADALHDRVAQILYAAQLGIDSLLETASSDADAERLVAVRELLTKGDASVRDVIHQLTAVGPQPTLTRRIHAEVESVEEEFGLPVRVELPPEDVLAVVPRSVADAVVKVAREGAVNAAKHGGPCRIAVSVDVTDRDVVVSVVDDGPGLDPGRRVRAGHGLASLRRQAGDICGTITLGTPANGFGTELLATFPL